MKILIDARLYGLEHAGLGRYTMNLVQKLVEIDKDNQYSILLRENYFNQLKFPKNWNKVKTDFRHYSVAEQILLPLIIRKQKPDVVHFPHFNIPILYRGKFVVTIHDILMHKFKGGETTTLPAPFYLIRRLGYRIAFERAVKASRRIIVPSQAVKKEVMKYHNIDKDKAIVSYEGLDSIYLKPAKISKATLKKYGLLGKQYYFYVGNAYPHKNLDRAIKAIKMLNEKQNETFYFAIAGSRDVFKKRLIESAKRLKAEKYVKVLGFVSDKDIISINKGSVAFVYPSLSEGFGLQGLEAISSGALVLASDIPVFKEVYGDCVTYFNPFDCTSICQAMEDAFQLKKEQKLKLINNSQKVLKKYSWEKMAKQTLKVYNEALE